MLFYQVKYFLVLCEELNFTRAAEKCNVSQPSLTRAIQKLEADLGGPLFRRERQNTHLTELGRLVQPYFEQVYVQLEAAKQRAKGFAILDEVVLNLGLSCTLGPGIIVGLIEAYRRRNAGVSLSLKDMTSGALLGHLDAGSLDVAILSLPEMDDRFHVIELFKEPFVIAFGPTHPFRRRKSLSVKDLHGENYLLRTNCEYGNQFHDILRKQGVEPNCIYRSEREDCIQVMARAGLGFAIIPAFSVTVEGIGIQPLADLPLARAVNLVTVRGRPHSPALGAFVRDAKRHEWPAQNSCASPS